MPESHRLIASGLDLSRIQKEVKENYHLFGSRPDRCYKGGGHSDVRDIWLRYGDTTEYFETGDKSVFLYPHESIWYPESDAIPESKVICERVLDITGCTQLGGVLLTKLPTGGRVRPHVDSGWHAEYYRKFYVPIKNKVGAVFGFEDGDIEPNEGDLWEFNNQYTHWVNNDSKEERIAMIICAQKTGGGSCLGEQ